MRTIFGILLVLMVLVTVSCAEITQVTYTRGGVGEGKTFVDGKLPMSIGMDDAFVGFQINPQTMTGAYGDRPPYIIDNGSGTAFNIMNGSVIIRPTIDRKATLEELVPNGYMYPSEGEWEVPWDGTHYYAYNGNGSRLALSTLYPSNFGVSGVKPGKYRFHAQKNIPDNASFNISTDSQDTDINITYGELAIGFYDYNDWLSGKLTPITKIIRGSKVHIEGSNTDSQNTYLWLTGKGLPSCGSNIYPLSLPITSNSPTVLNTSTVGSLDGEYDLSNNGFWSFNWDTSGLPIQAGDYTFHAASVNPADVFPHIPAKSTCYSTEMGVCAFDSCPGCAPKPQEATITLVDPSPLNLTVTPSDVSRCCCPGYPCGTSDSPITITLSGITGVSRLPMQIWLFGNNQIGDHGYLFSDTFETFLDPDGTIKINLNEYFFRQNNLKLCDLEAGTYNVVVQVPKVTQVGNETFDVTLETSTFAKNVPNALFPHAQDPERIYVVKSDPIYWTKVFVAEGPDALSGYQAYTKLIEALNAQGVRDQYATASFILKDNACTGGSVDFSGTPTSGYVPLTVQFNDTSTFTGTNRTWDFGDNFTSTELNPVHVYTTPGAYTVTLQVTNGTSHKEQKKYDYIIVNEVPAKYYEPVANFTYTINHGATGEVQFIDQSSGSTPLTYFWQFGDSIGSNSTNVSPTHQYASLGVYPVTLTVTDTFGKSNSSTMPVDVTAVPLYSPPVAKFTYVSKNGEPMTIQFIDQSSSSTKLDYLWDFGDGANSTEKVPAHTYVTPATYNVSLSVTDTYANVSTVIQPVQVPATPNGTPSIDFTADIVEGQYPLTVQFLDTTTTTWADSWQWNFGDGAVSSLRSPIHTYTTPGLYTVTLRAANVNGEGSEMTKVDYINVQNQPPVITATADPMTGNFPLRVEFTAYATVNNKTPEMSAPLIQSWLWDFGDSSISSEQNPVHVYEAPGNYQVTVTCQLYDGVSSIADVGTIVVGPQPYANFYWEYLDKDETCCYLVKFTDTSVGATDISWDFGDGLTSVERNPTHRFKEVGFYNVTQTVSALGKVNSMTQIVQITSGYTTPTPTPTPVPVPGAVEALFYTTAIGTRTIQFTDQSTGNPNSWEWDFGDATTSGEQNPRHLYPTDGEFEVRLKVSNGQFSDTTYQTIGVR